MADNKIIHDLLKEVRKEQKDSIERTGAHREEAIRWHSETVHRLDKYNYQLEQHIDGVNTLKKLHNNNVTRIETLEEPRKALKLLKKWFIWVATFAGAIITVAKLKGLF